MENLSGVSDKDFLEEMDRRFVVPIVWDRQDVVFAIQDCGGTSGEDVLETVFEELGKAVCDDEDYMPDMIESWTHLVKETVDDVLCRMDQGVCLGSCPSDMTR